MKRLSAEEIRERILTCTRCHLNGHAGIRSVPWSGPVPCDIALVGEAPGLQENVQGYPFVEDGASGRLLRNELRKHGIEPDSCFIANTVSCFPGGTPTVLQQKACRLHLRRQLLLAQPRLILALGSVALNFFKPGERITRRHGESWVDERWRSGELTTVFACYHPAATMHDPTKRLDFKEDIAAFASLCEFGFVP